MQYIIPKNAGLTLIELLLYIGIATLVLPAIVLFYSFVLEINVKAHTIEEVEQQGLHAVELITAVARNAKSITAPTASSSASTLTLDVIDISKDPTIVDLSTGMLRITEGPGTPVALTSSRVTASSLMFSNYSRASTPGTIRIQFTLTYTSQSGSQQYTYAKTFFASASLRQP